MLFGFRRLVLVFLGLVITAGVGWHWASNLLPLIDDADSLYEAFNVTVARNQKNIGRNKSPKIKILILAYPR